MPINSDVPHQYVIVPETIEYDFYKQVLEVMIERQWARSVNVEDTLPPLYFYFRSNGGSSRDAMAVVNLIQADGNVHGVIVGDTISCAATIWASCQQRSVIGDSVARIGIHPVSWDGIEGIFDAKRLAVKADEFEWIDRRQIEIYTKASNRPVSWWRDLYQDAGKLSWLSADTLIDIGMAQVWRGLPV